MKRFFVLVLILFFFNLNLTAQDVTLKEILDGYETTASIPNLTATLTVQLISARGEVREIKADAYQKAMNEYQVSRLFLFDYPPSVRNTGILVNSFTNGDANVIWFYLPAVKRIKRIALATAGGNYFMGSDFSYSDFIPKSRADYIQEFLGEKVIDGTPCYVVKETGKTQKMRKDLKLSYMINYYRKDDFIMFGRDYYDLAGELLKEYRVKDSVILGQFIYPTVIEMENIQTGHRSILKMTNLSTDIIPDRYFTTRFLENR